VLGAVQGQLPRWNPGQIASLCWGLAKLDQGLPQGFAEVLLLEIQAQMPDLSSSSLGQVMWAMARLGMSPEASFREALWQELHIRSAIAPLLNAVVAHYE
jgi:hypothetical protein